MIESRPLPYRIMILIIFKTWEVQLLLEVLQITSYYLFIKDLGRLEPRPLSL